DEGRDRGRQQHGGAAGLRAQELAERRLEAARPGGLARERGGGLDGQGTSVPTARCAPRVQPVEGRARPSYGGAVTGRQVVRVDGAFEAALGIVLLARAAIGGDDFPGIDA